jgi:hypothetical protein
MAELPLKAYIERVMRFYKESELAFKIQSLVQNELPYIISSNSMNGNALSLKLSEVCKFKKVLEFGSGGSTLLLAEIAEKLISVESDKKYASQVNKRLKNLNYHSKASVIYANIGPTKSFGQPFLFLRPIFKRRYKNYVKIFSNLESYFRPDIVFVDGRFRVWCSIRACQSAKNDFLLIIDDYFDRPEYHVVEKILGSAKVFSENTAFFEVRPNSLNWDHSNNFLEYASDYR